MIPVSTRIKAAFRNDSMLKHYKLQFVNEEAKDIYNDSITEESMEIIENLCSEEQLHYGRCEACSCEFEMLNLYESLNGCVFDLYLQLGDYDDEIFTVGRYIIEGETVSNDKKVTGITAYDIMYYLRDLDVTYWYYNELSFPMTLKQIRDSLFEYIGQAQETIELINDDIIMQNGPLDGENYVTFATIMESICEVDGVFGHIGRDGEFKYVSLISQEVEETYPGEDTYPSSETFPSSIRSTSYDYGQHLVKYDMWWENYKCKMIDRVQLRNKTGAAVVEYALPGKEEGTNIYVIQNNWCVWEASAADLQKMAKRFAEKVQKVTYTPVEIETKMDLSMEVGDNISFITTDNQRIFTYMLTRDMKGVHSAFDKIVSTGYEEFINSSPNTDGSIVDMQDNISDLDDRVSQIEAGDGNIRILSVEELPSAPEKNVLYLIQGKVYVS